MLFDVFFSITPTPVDGKCPSEQEMWQNTFDQIRVADDLGYKVAWFAESHLSHQAQLQNSAPVCPTFEGEIGLNTDFPQLATRVLSVTKQIGVGSAVLNILSNGGPVANAERIAQLVSMHHALADFRNREIHVAFSAGRFEYARRGFGILPRNELEALVWEELQPLIFQEAVEVYLRLLRGDVLQFTNLIPCVLSSSKVADQARWLTLIRALKQREELSVIREKNQDAQIMREKLAWCMDVRRIDDHQVQFPFRFIYPNQHIGVISKPLDASCLRLLLASHDPLLQRLVNKWLPVQVANLSITAPEIIEQTHELMQQAYHPSGGKWKREYMPRTVLVFLNADSNLTQVEQNQAAHYAAVNALKAYWKAIEGTILDENSPVHNLRNAIWGCPLQVASQLRNGYHPEDRLMLWFDFFNHDSAAVCRSMRIFMEQVVPFMEDGRTLDLMQPEWTDTDSSNDLQNEAEHHQSTFAHQRRSSVAHQRRSSVAHQRRSSVAHQRRSSVAVRCDIVLIITLLPPAENINEEQWTNEWLKNSSSTIETQTFDAIADHWPTISDLTRCLGVVITGSTCSCLNDYPHTESLFAFFKRVIQLEVPVLTICYSAQMLVRWLAGKEYVQRRSEPLLGFVHIKPTTDRGLGRYFSLLADAMDESLISAVSQSDEFILPDEFKRFQLHIGSVVQETQFIHGASAIKSKYQAFQLVGLPVWGIQFHPNWSAEAAEIIIGIRKSRSSNIVVERQGLIDEDRRHNIAQAFVSACRHHVMLKLVIKIQMSGLTNLSISSYVAQKHESIARSEMQLQDIHFQGNRLTLPGYISLSGSAMQMAYRVIVVPNTSYSLSLESELAAAIKVVFDKVNMIVNNWNSESEISKLVENFQNGAEIVVMSPLLARIFRTAFEVHEVTDKAFDPTVGNDIKKPWKASESLSPSDIEGSSFQVGLSRLYSLSAGDNNNSVELHAIKCKTDHIKACVGLDLCSIAKGFAVDLLCDTLQDMEIEDYSVEWAGEIRVRGLDPFQNSWKTVIVRPPLLSGSFDYSERPFSMFDDSSICVQDITTMDGDSSELTLIATKKHRLESLFDNLQSELLPTNKKSSFVVDLVPQYASQDIALATSGTLNDTLGNDRSHIINPSTLQPVRITKNSSVCVTVILGSTYTTIDDAQKDGHTNDIGAWADALATATMVQSSALDCAQFLWNIANRLNNSPLPSKYCLLDFYITSKDGHTFSKSSVSTQLLSQTRWLLTGLPLPVCVLTGKIPFPVPYPYIEMREHEARKNTEDEHKKPLTLVCVCTSAFASTEGSFFVSLDTKNRLCRLLANDETCFLTEVTAYFLSPEQEELACTINNSPHTAVLTPKTYQELEQNASRIVPVQLTTHHKIGDHIVFQGLCPKPEVYDTRILCYTKKHYFESRIKSIYDSLPQPSCNLTRSRISAAGLRELKSLGMTIAVGVCSCEPPVMYIVTSANEIQLGEITFLDFGSSFTNGSESASAATLTAIAMATPSIRVTALVNTIISLPKTDLVLVMMDIVGLSSTVMPSNASSSDVEH